MFIGNTAKLFGTITEVRRQQKAFELNAFAVAMKNSQAKYTEGQSTYKVGTLLKIMGVVEQ